MRWSIALLRYSIAKRSGEKAAMRGSSMMTARLRAGKSETRQAGSHRCWL
jgi:hypothetical protein